jgi:hypothetical protein
LPSTVASAVAVAPEEAVARAFLAELGRGEWSHPKSAFTAKLAEAVPAVKLQEVWQHLEGVAGRFGEVATLKLEAKPPVTIVHLTATFGHTEKVFRVTVDEKHEIAGFFYGPSTALLERRTRDLVTKASAGDFAGASAAFGTVMKNALPPAKLESTWRALEGQVGRLEAIDGVTLKPVGEGAALLADARFSKARLVVKVAYDASDEITGLFFLPPEVPWAPPAYARADAFSEREVSVGTSPALPGTLSLPRGGDGGPTSTGVPAVVLVHGSGPSDRDQSVGGVKVFKDFAQGLASRGIAVLRYEKRSRHSPAGVVTEKEEVLDGAHDAIELLRHTPGIDPKRIFIVGHSQGGNLAPRIAKENPGLAGVVILAGNARPLQDLLIDQYSYFATLHPEKPDLAKKVEEARAFKQRVESPTLRAEDDPRPPTGGGMTGAYFLFQRGYDPVATVRGLHLPALILQGERDYQVTAKDLEAWKKGLAGAPGVTIRAYPGLNHLFVVGSGTPRPEEYEQPGHVDEAVVGDVAAWILRPKK